MRNGNETAKFQFICPKCEESLEVNDSMKHTLIERGCVVCGATVRAESFTKDAPPDSS
jgi:hypothetical protein